MSLISAKFVYKKLKHTLTASINIDFDKGFVPYHSASKTTCTKLDFCNEVP